MKKSLFILLAASLGFAACQMAETDIPEFTGEALSAQIEQNEETKTILDENSNIRWSENDQIVAFMKTSYGHKYQVIPSFAGKTYADFSMVSSGNGNNFSAGMEWDHNVAYYPYAEGIECVKSGENYTLDVTLPAEQTYVANSFGNGSWPMVAVSENYNITFKNVCGGMLLQLKGSQKVASITVQGKNNEILSGTATVTAYTDAETKPAITMTSTDAASRSITLNCGEGIQLNESTITEFIIALPPVVFTKGFTVTITDSEGNEQIVETDKENTVLRSSLLVMPEVTFERAARPGDYVDGYGINHGQGIKIGETVWAPVNCGYHKTDYKYGKLYQWGRKYGQGYCMSYATGEWYQSYSDASVPERTQGPVSLSEGQSKDNKNKFFYVGSPYDWLGAKYNDELWNSNNDSYPVKTEYDPCPEGWRVPTYNEFLELDNNYSEITTDESGLVGRWFSGPQLHSSSVSRVFLPAAGYNDSNGIGEGRGGCGCYWMSIPLYDHYAYEFYFNETNVKFKKSQCRAYGYSVRCVREIDKI